MSSPRRAALTTTSATTFWGAAGEKVNLNFEVGPSTADQLQLTGNFDVGEGGATITVTSLGLAANTTYDLITFPAGTGTGFATGTGTTVGALTLANPILGFGVDPTFALVLSQVVLSFGIPFALVPLVWITARRSVLGPFRNRLTTTVLGVVSAALLITLNLVLLWLVFTGT